MVASLKYGNFEFYRTQLCDAPSNDNARRLSLVAQPKRAVAKVRAAARRVTDTDNKLLPHARSRQASTCKGGVSLPQRSEDRRGGGLFNWLGNNKTTTDDADGFYDRSLGDITNDSASDKPYQLKSAELGGARGGELEARYDDAGNMVKMALQRSGPCLGGAGSDCNQQFVYDWDEVGRLVRARRWDGNNDAVDTFDAANAGNAAADLRYVYDASDQRVLKEAVDQDPVAGEQKSYTLYIFSSLELRRTQFGSEYVDAGNTGSDYELSHWTISPYLMANGVRLARLVYHGEDVVPEDGVASGGMPGDVNASTSQLHVFFELGDHLGSTSVVLDKATGELVERATFQAYGGAESDYRPGRWANFREDYRFTGKEEDVEVGLQYFGKRFLNPLLGRWISADPLAIHAPGEADANLYAYVMGRVLMATDPLGLECGGGSDCNDDVGSGESPTQETQADDGSGGNSTSYLDGSQGEYGASSENAYSSTAPADRSFEDGGHPLSPEMTKTSDPCASGACVLRPSSPSSLATQMADGTGSSRFDGGGGGPNGTSETGNAERGNARQVPNLPAADAERDATVFSVARHSTAPAAEQVDELAVGGLAALGLGITIDVALQSQGGLTSIGVRAALVWGVGFGLGYGASKYESRDTTQSFTVVTPVGGGSIHQSTDHNLQNHYNGASYSRGPGWQFGVTYSQPGMSTELNVPVSPVD